MWTLVTVVAFVLVVYCMLFWTNNDEALPGQEPLPVDNTSTSRSASQPTTASLDSEKTWYGFTLRGYRDEYCISTTQPPDAVVSIVRRFYADQNAKLSSNVERRLIFARGRKIYQYIGGSDKWPAQEIEVTVRIQKDVTKIMIEYRVFGLHLRVPPNQLRDEVLDLSRRLAEPGSNVF